MMLWITGVWLLGVVIFAALVYAHGEQRDDVEGCSVE